VTDDVAPDTLHCAVSLTTSRRLLPTNQPVF